MASFGIKPSRDESLVLVHQAFEEVGSAYNLSPAAIDNMEEEVVDEYSRPDRFHHAISHLGELVVFTNFFGDRENMGNAYKNQKIDRPSVLAMSMYHDFIYNTDVDDPTNVARSAMWAFTSLHDAGVPDTALTYIIKGIRASSDHSTTGDLNIDFFLDADMSILGTPAGRYDQYSKDVSDEYFVNVDPERYFKGRLAFLKKFVRVDEVAEIIPIFNTAFARELFDTQARSNMKREFDWIEATIPS